MEECRRWNDAAADKAKQIVRDEADAGNPHALDVNMNVTPYNSDDVEHICKKVHVDSKHACSDGTTLVVNADDGA